MWGGGDLLLQHVQWSGFNSTKRIRTWVFPVYLEYVELIPGILWLKTGPGKQEKIHSPACQFGTLLSMLIFTFKLGYWANTLSCHSLSTSWWKLRVCWRFSVRFDFYCFNLRVIRLHINFLPMLCVNSHTLYNDRWVQFRYLCH